MNRARFAQALRNQTPLAIKVFNAVPINEAWTFGFIQAELFRQGINKPRNVVEGCLGCLVEAGLVLKGSKGLFIRTAITEKAEASPEIKVVQAISPPPDQPTEPEQMTATQKTTTPKPARTAAQRLADLSAKISDMAEQLLEMTEEIDKASQQVQQEAKGHANELEKLTQLKELLKGL